VKICESFETSASFQQSDPQEINVEVLRMPWSIDMDNLQIVVGRRDVETSGRLKEGIK
jgi:hypothetical protein